MRKLLIGLLVLGTASAFAQTACSRPQPNASIAFELIERPGNLSLETFLNENLVSKTALNENCETMYHVAIRTKNDQALKTLDKIGYGPRNKDEVNQPHNFRGYLYYKVNFYEYSLIFGNASIVKKFMSMGGGLGETANDGLTSLMIAADNNSKEIIELLILAGDNVQSVSNDRRTALMIAALNNSRKDVLELLIRAGSDINATTYYGATPLMFAAKRNTKEVIDLLIRAGSDVRPVDHIGTTVLMHAVEKNTKEVIELLIRSGCDVRAVNRDRDRAYDIAKKNKRSQDILDLLK